jgi:hypothetical protein
MRAVILLVAIFTTGPVFAALAPQYYEEARANAESVLVVRIERATGLPFMRGYGPCRVSGIVEAVERGSRYRVGEPITISVPCRRQNAQIPASGVQYEGVSELRRSRWGRAWLDAHGELALYQYDILASYP